MLTIPSCAFALTPARDQAHSLFVRSFSTLPADGISFEALGHKTRPPCASVGQPNHIGFAKRRGRANKAERCL
jgi:hypothetical protein